MSYAVLVLEQPWWELDEDPGQTSVRHFLDGLSRLEGLETFYATFYDTNSFGHALTYLLDARKLEDIDHLIVYVASHGSGARIGRDKKPGMNLNTVFDRLATHGKGKIAGVILDSCEVGGAAATIKAGMQRAGVRWTLGYGASLDWLLSTLINLHVLAVMAHVGPKAIEKPKKLKAALQEALSPFNPWQVVEYPFNDDEEFEDEDVADEDGVINLSKALMAFVHTKSADTPVECLAAESIWPELAET